MNPADFVKVAEETMDSLPEEFGSRIDNVAILVEDYPPNQSPPRPGRQRHLLPSKPRSASLTYRSALPTSCSIKKTLRRSAPMRRKFVTRFARLSYTNSVITSA